VKGKITDENGVPIPGASIVIKGTSVGTKLFVYATSQIQIFAGFCGRLWRKTNYRSSDNRVQYFT
jgi:hypothetical protein